MPSRSHNPNATRTTLASSGMRQPNASSDSSGMSQVMSAIAPVATSTPVDGPICANDALRPRCRPLPCSTVSNTAPAHSPPSAMPCTNRSVTSSTGASTPTDS